MKRVLIFSLTYYPNQVSGAEAALKEITDRIDPSEIEFHLITLRYNSILPKVEKVGNILVHRIGLTTKNPSFTDLGKMPLDLNKPLYQFLAPLKGLLLYRQYKYDAIWALMAHSAGIPTAIFKLFKPKIKYVLTLQEGDPTDQIEKTMRPLGLLFRRAFTKADIVQAISGHLASWAKQHGVPDERLEIIPNGANPSDLFNSVPEAEVLELKKQFHKKPDDIYLVNTARLVTQKAHDDTIRALAYLPDNIYFLLVGDGPEENNLKTLVRDLKLEGRVIFVGRVDRSEVTKYRKIADIFVGPSRSEGLGNAWLSAMASQLPVIATQEGGLAEFIFDAQRNPDKPTTAWAVDKNSPPQIAEAVKDILLNPNKVKIITARAQQMVKEKYNWDTIAEDMRRKIFARVL
jgi:glycosyltransferase involved in cell wall biosynthesis